MPPTKIAGGKDNKKPDATIDDDGNDEKCSNGNDNDNDAGNFSQHNADFVMKRGIGKDDNGDAVTTTSSVAETENNDNDEEKQEGGEGEGGPKAISKRPSKKKKKVFDFTKDAFLTSEERKTTKGGYAHTERSRSKISEANTGNTPWNKGRNRSSADKARIAAGVRARNRAILLEKLRRLGMSEDEYNDTKRKIKYLRERVRRAKVMNKKHQIADAELKLQEAIDAMTEKEEKEEKEEEPPKVEKTEEEIRMEEERKKEEEEAREKAFTRVVTWTPFSFGEDNQTYKQICPDGGPGGMICCEFCAKKYSSFLSQTVGDMEIQRTHKCGNEVKELLKFLAEGRESLDLAMGIARKKAPPLPRGLLIPTEIPKPVKRKFRQQQQPDNSDWNLTSTIDVGLGTETELV